MSARIRPVTEPIGAPLHLYPSATRTQLTTQLTLTRHQRPDGTLFVLARLALADQWEVPGKPPRRRWLPLAAVGGSDVQVNDPADDTAMVRLHVGTAQFDLPASEVLPLRAWLGQGRAATATTKEH